MKSALRSLALTFASIGNESHLPSDGAVHKDQDVIAASRDVIWDVDIRVCWVGELEQRHLHLLTFLHCHLQRQI